MSDPFNLDGKSRMHTSKTDTDYIKKSSLKSLQTKLCIYVWYTPTIFFCSHRSQTLFHEFFH